MSYRIVVGRPAERSLRKRVPPERAEQIRRAINGLTEDPRPVHRVVYGVDDDLQEVFVAEAWHRQRDHG